MNLSSVPDHARRVKRYDFFKLLDNGRIRYYASYKPAKIQGKTAGARLVLEVDQTTGHPLRTWYESYDHQGRVLRIHPKTPQDLGHIEIDPETGREIHRW